MTNWKESQPNSLFQVSVDYEISNQEQESLVLLYQPIVGSEAFSLYLTMLSEVDSEGISSQLLHSELITILNLSMKQIQLAKKKLEGIGLLTTFVKNDSEYGAQFFYRLNHPETAERFFKDEILTLTLLSRVGQRKFDLLLDRLTPNYRQFQGYEDISAGFNDVYSFREEQLLSETDQLNKISAKYSDPRPAQKVSAISESFDWSYFLQGIEKFGLKMPSNEAEFKEEIYTFHNLFGINELEMTDFCSKAFDYYTNQIDQKELKRAIYRTFDPDKKQRQSKVIRNEQVNLSDTDQQTYRYNSLKLNGFSAQDIQVIMDSEKNFPLNYLEALKKERGGYTTPQERSLVKYLVTKSGLPNSVINILINYVYNIKRQPTLKAEYVNRIANEWAQHSIFSPEKAIEHVRELAKEGKEKRQVRKYGTGKGTTRQETIPEWITEPVEEKKLSEKEQAKLDKEIQEFLNKGGSN